MGCLYCGIVLLVLGILFSVLLIYCQLATVFRPSVLQYSKHFDHGYCNTLSTRNTKFSPYSEYILVYLKKLCYGYNINNTLRSDGRSRLRTPGGSLNYDPRVYSQHFDHQSDTAILSVHAVRNTLDIPSIYSCAWSNYRTMDTLGSDEGNRLTNPWRFVEYCPSPIKTHDHASPGSGVV